MKAKNWDPNKIIIHDVNTYEVYDKLHREIVTFLSKKDTPNVSIDTGLFLEFYNLRKIMFKAMSDYLNKTTFIGE